MAFTYQPLADTAASVLAQFGKVVTLRHVSVGTYAPGTGFNTTTNTDTTRKGAMFDFPPGAINGPGGLILQGDKKLIMEAGDAPSIQHRVIDGVDNWGILGIKEIKPANVPIAYVLHLRK